MRPLKNSQWQYIGPNYHAYGEIQTVVINEVADVVAVGDYHIWHGIAATFFNEFRYVGQLQDGHLLHNE